MRINPQGTWGRPECLAADDYHEPLTDPDACDVSVGPNYEQVDCCRTAGHDGRHFDVYRGIWWELP